MILNIWIYFSVKIKIIISEISQIHFYRDTFGEKANGSLRSPKCPIWRSDASFPLVGERSEHVRELILIMAVQKN